MANKANIISTDIASIIDGGKNKALKVRTVLETVTNYVRQSEKTTITLADCISLGDRTYSYEMSSDATTSLEIDGVGAPNGGVILNKIIPHSDIIDGQELLLFFKNGGGLTFLTKGGVTSNIIFIKQSIGCSPAWGADNFIAQNNQNESGGAVQNGVPINYEKNLTVLLKWSIYRNRWIEIHRSGGNIY